MKGKVDKKSLITALYVIIGILLILTGIALRIWDILNFWFCFAIVIIGAFTLFAGVDRITGEGVE